MTQGGWRSLPAPGSGMAASISTAAQPARAVSLRPCGYTFPFRPQLPASVLWPFKLELFTVLRIRKATLTRKGSTQLRKSECWSLRGWTLRLSYSEVSQKEKNKYHVIPLFCGTQKNGTGELICKADTETRKVGTNMDTKQRKDRWDELGDWD